MLRTTLCCVLIAATSAMAWETLEDVPKALNDDAQITYGYGYGTTDNIWGVFPIPGKRMPRTLRTTVRSTA